MKKLIYLFSSTLFLISCVSTNQNLSSKNDIEIITENQQEIVKNEISEKELFIQSISEINISLISSPKSTFINKKFSDPFVFCVKNNQNENIKNFTVTVEFPVKKENNQIIFSSIEIISDENGNCIFNPEIPNFSADTEILCYPFTNNEQFISFAKEKSVCADWKVRSDLISKGAVLFIWDFNEKNRPTTNSYEILSKFRNSGMTNVGNAPISESSYLDKPLSTIYKDNYEIIEDAYGYLIYGTVEFEKPVEKVEDQYECSLISKIIVIRMKDGSEVYKNEFKHLSFGENWNKCVSKCKTELAEIIVNSLDFGI